MQNPRELEFDEMEAWLGEQPVSCLAMDYFSTGNMWCTVDHKIYAPVRETQSAIIALNKVEINSL